jgi:hypothetical protein
LDRACVNHTADLVIRETELAQISAELGSQLFGLLRVGKFGHRLDQASVSEPASLSVTLRLFRLLRLLDALNLRLYKAEFFAHCVASML